MRRSEVFTDYIISLNFVLICSLVSFIARNKRFSAYFFFAAFNPSSNVFHSMVSPHPIKFKDINLKLLSSFLSQSFETQTIALPRSRGSSAWNPPSTEIAKLQSRSRAIYFNIFKMRLAYRQEFNLPSEEIHSVAKIIFVLSTCEIPGWYIGKFDLRNGRW